MNNVKYQKLHSMICEAINQLELLISHNNYIEHNKRYTSLLEYLKSCQSKVSNHDVFEYELKNHGLRLTRYLDGSIDQGDLFDAICDIDEYFFNEFLLNMSSQKYIKLNEMLCSLMNQLEEIIKSNKNIHHADRYEMFFKYLDYCKEKAAVEDLFELEKGNMSLGLMDYLVKEIDPKDFFSNVCMVEKYFFDEFVLK